MKDVIQFENIAELKTYMSKNQLDLEKDIPDDIKKDDRNNRINVILNVKGKNEFHLSGDFIKNPPFVIISYSNNVPIDSINLSKR